MKQLPITSYWSYEVIAQFVAAEDLENLNSFKAELGEERLCLLILIKRHSYAD